MKFTFTLLIAIFLSTRIFSQDSEENIKKFTYDIGFQTRITPIYLKRVPVLITVPDRDIFEQPDMYLSGPSLNYRIEKFISSSTSITFTQSLRYDFLYKTLSFNNQQVQGFYQQTHRAVISDIYLDVGHSLPLKSSELKLNLGIAICGIGTSYLLTQRFLDNNNQSFYIASKENFEFPALTFKIDWHKGKFNTGVRLGYCWDNPTLYKTPFLFPELDIQYQLFTF